MTKHKSFSPAYSLNELAAQLGEHEGGLGGLVAIGHQAGDTIGSFRFEADGNGHVILRPGRPLPEPPGPVIDTDTVYILGQLQQVTAYRGA